MCLGREINESRGQSWEQSDKEALRRDLPGGLAAEAHAPTQRPWVLALFAEMGSRTKHSAGQKVKK